FVRYLTVLRKELNRPASQMFIFMAKERHQIVVSESLRYVQRPEGPELASYIRILIQNATEGRMHGGVGSSLLQKKTGVPHIPIVWMELQLDELLGGLR